MYNVYTVLLDLVDVSSLRCWNLEMLPKKSHRPKASTIGRRGVEKNLRAYGGNAKIASDSM